MKRYVARLRQTDPRSCNPSMFLELTAGSLEAARQIVLDTERCPESAILEIKEAS
jgi:hypothetical protein